MEHVSNEEKAIVLSVKASCEAYFDEEAQKQYLNPSTETIARINAYGACMEMAEWKDEEHKQEKQQWIDKACEWWTNNWRKYVMTDKDGIVALTFWKGDFKQAMEEKL